MTRFVLLLVLLVGAAEGVEPWERRAALVEAQRVINRALPLLAESERGDPRPAAKALGDSSWPLRLLACDRLEAHKLTPEVVAALRRACGPGKSGPEPEDPDWKAAKDFADAVVIGGEVPKAPSRDDVVRALVTTILLRVRDGSERDKRALLELALPYTQLCKGVTQRWIAGQLAQFLEPQRLLNDLGAKTLKEALGERGRPVIRWYAAHREKLNWDPRAKAFRVGR